VSLLHHFPRQGQLRRHTSYCYYVPTRSSPLSKTLCMSSTVHIMLELVMGTPHLIRKPRLRNHESIFALSGHGHVKALCTSSAIPRQLPHGWHTSLPSLSVGEDVDKSKFVWARSNQPAVLSLHRITLTKRHKLMACATCVKRDMGYSFNFLAVWLQNMHVSSCADCWAFIQDPCQVSY